VLTAGRRQFLAWCLARAEKFGSAYFTPEVRLCLERTRGLLEGGGAAREELIAQERLLLQGAGGEDGFSRAGLEASWAVLLELAEDPRSHALRLTLSLMARTARLRELDAEHFASRAITQHQAEKSRPAQHGRFNAETQKAFDDEAAAYERAERENR